MKDLKVELLGFISWFFFIICSISIPAIVLLSDSKFLNPNISADYLHKKVHGINSCCCLPPLPDNEGNKIISNIEESQFLEPFPNYPRRVIFNPDADLSYKILILAKYSNTNFSGFSGKSYCILHKDFTQSSIN